MALGRGYALPFVAGKQGAGGGGGAYGLLWQDAVNDNVPPLTLEDGNAGQGSCLFTRGKDLYDKQVSATPSLLIVPQMRGLGKLAVDIPSPVYFDVTRATTATRVNSSGLIESVASGVPRLDWYATPAAQDAAATGCPALLVEASAQNLAFQSQAFDVSGNWTQSNVTVTPNVTATLDPAGGNTADLLADSVTTGSTVHRIYTTPVPASAGSISVVSGTTYSTSLFVKAGTSSVLRIVLRRDNEAVIGIGDTIFNVTSGTITSGSGTIENYGNGWYRCTNIGTSNFTGAARIFINLYDTAGNQSYIGTAGTNNMYIWGAQLETSAAASTYIPTTTAAVTRNADLVNASGSTISGLIGQTEGTIYAEVVVSKLLGSVQRSIVNIGNSTSNRIFLGYSSLDTNKIRFLVADSSGDRADFRISAAATGVLKIAARYSSGDSNLYVNGVAASETADLSFSLSALQHLHIGHNLDELLQFNDTIRAVALYTEALTNDDLATLTT